MNCTNCPRRCPIDRTKGDLGFCCTPAEFKVARIALHPWEEPCVSGKNGSGTVFFSGCNLRCVFCQNREISREGVGRIYSAEELQSAILDLQRHGAENINLVTPTHYLTQLVPFLRELKPLLQIPVVYNCGGYESAEALRLLEGLADIYLPDVKYYSAELSQSYSSAPDYFPIAMEALGEMLRQVGTPQFSPARVLQKGVIVRHLVLPGCRKDSIRILQELAGRFGVKAYLLSLMNQYTPEFAQDCSHPNLRRRVTAFEYQSVLEVAQNLGFDGYSQSRSSATAAYTPRFSSQ